MRESSRSHFAFVVSRAYTRRTDTAGVCFMRGCSAKRLKPCRQNINIKVLHMEYCKVKYKNKIKISHFLLIFKPNVAIYAIAKK